MARTRTTQEIPKRQLPKRVPPLTISRTFGSKSPLADLNLQAFLARCMSTNQWHTYTSSEKKRIFESLPSSSGPNPNVSPGTSLEGENLHQPPSPSCPAASPPAEQQDMSPDTWSNPPMNSSDIAKDPFVKRAIARFKRDLGDGYYEKAWQDKARRAHEERMDGKFDDHVRQHAEDMFEERVDEYNDGKDELAPTSEDGEYSDTTKRRSKGKGRPKNPKRGQNNTGAEESALETYRRTPAVENGRKPGLSVQSQGENERVGHLASCRNTY